MCERAIHHVLFVVGVLIALGVAAFLLTRCGP